MPNPRAEIINKTKGRQIVPKSVLLTSVFSKGTGLMFSKKIVDTGYIFVFDAPARVDMHMFFVFFPIDVIFLDPEKKVVEIKEGFLPFTVYLPKSTSNFIIELPAGAVKKTGTDVGDIIFW